MMDKEEITRKIIACAFQVHNSLGGGFLESVYRNALLIELSGAGLSVIKEKPISVFYQNHLVGSFYADIIVEDSVVLELKAIEALAKAHEVQLVNYLKATGYDLGLLINFGPLRVDVKRKTRVFMPGLDRARRDEQDGTG